MALLGRLTMLVLALLPAMAIAADTVFTPEKPPAVPLAVRSPYLNVWLNAGTTQGGNLGGQWPVFWQDQIMGWAGIIRVDGVAYSWLGKPGPDAVNQTAVDWTATRSTFMMDVAGQVEMNITFLSPVTPNDFKRQSLIFSYLNVEVRSSDGASHDVELYADISAEWASGDRTAVAQWAYNTSNDIAYHKVWKQVPQVFTESDEQAQWGNWWWATDSVNGLTYASGADVDVRGSFVSNGSLGNSQDTNYRAVQDNWPVFGFAKGLGSVGSDGANTLFSIGLTQDDCVQFNGSAGYLPVPSLWTSYFDDELAALEFFHKDYSTASGLAAALDNQIQSDSVAAAGTDYAIITTLSTRQAFGATQLAGTSVNPYLFLKEISSNGNMQTVDVIFPAHPIFLYTNPELLKLLLKPHFEYQESGYYPNQYAIHDLGTHYPNGTGHGDGEDEAMPLEECGNQLIMVLAYALKANDTNFLSEHYTLLEQWAGFLVNESLYPNDQLSTDDFAGTLVNQTNLALKGIIGIEAMSVIAALTGNLDDASYYHTTATSYVGTWQTLTFTNSTNGTHAMLAYNLPDSYNLLYNLYGDVLLGLNLIPQTVYDAQSAFYPTLEASSGYGVPLDSRHRWTKADWELWQAAVSSDTTRDMFIDDLAKWIRETPTYRALTDLYDVDTGGYPGIYFVARPVMGGSFALLVEGLGGADKAAKAGRT